MPRFVRLQFSDTAKASASRPLGAAQGVIMGMAVSGALWLGFLVAVVA